MQVNISVLLLLVSPSLWSHAELTVCPREKCSEPRRLEHALKACQEHALKACQNRFMMHADQSVHRRLSGKHLPVDAS